MPDPDPIPVYIGDDWTFAFSYRQAGGNGAPVDLTGATILCDLFYPFSSTPLALSQAGGQTGLIDAEQGQFAIAVRRTVTSGFVPATPKMTSALHISMEKSGVRRTLGVRPLLLLDRQTMPPPRITSVESIDPITGAILSFNGLTDFLATLPVVETAGGVLALDLDLGQSLVN